MAITRRTASLLWLRVVARRGHDPGRLRGVLGERIEPRIADEIRSSGCLATAGTAAGLVAVFATSSEAAQCTLRLRDFFRDENWKDHGVDPLRAEMALHSGRVALGETPPAGGAVERVAMLCRATPPGEVRATAEYGAALTAEGDSRFRVERVAASQDGNDREAEAVFELAWTHERPQAGRLAADAGEFDLVPFTVRSADPSSPTAPATPGPLDPSSGTGERPRRVFISYSWDSDDYKRWVERLAATLRKNGVDARLDRWRRREQSIPEFMSSEVRNADKIVILCTPELQRRIHATEDGERRFGVGWESALVTGDVFAGAAWKVIAVLVRGTWREAAPSWLQGHPYINLTDPAALQQGVLELVRQIVGETPTAPPLGALPEGLREEPAEPLF